MSSIISFSNEDQNHQNDQELVFEKSEAEKAEEEMARKEYQKMQKEKAKRHKKQMKKIRKEICQAFTEYEKSPKIDYRLRGELFKFKLTQIFVTESIQKSIYLALKYINDELGNQSLNNSILYATIFRELIEELIYERKELNFIPILDLTDVKTQALKDLFWQMINLPVALLTPTFS